MTLSRRIVQAHGGTIAVGNGPGGEIILELPHLAAQDSCS